MSDRVQDPVSGVRIFNAPGEEDLTGIISSTCAGAFRLARELWGLEPPRDCRIHVMTSWRRFMFDSTPGYLKPLMISSYPFWAARVQRTWPYAGAWTQRYGKRVVIGIKPPRLLETSDRSVGALMYVKEKDMAEKLRHLTCHELTHACASPLRLPAWLNEGIAMLSVDRCLGRDTIRRDSLELLREQPPRCVPPGYRQMSRLDVRGLAMHTVRGYWLVRLLEERQPGFLKGIFQDQVKLSTIETHMAGLLDLPPDRFWQQVDDLLLK